MPEVNSRRVFIICPVAELTDNESAEIQEHIRKLESEGDYVHYPPRDTDQVDLTGGYRICIDNGKEISKADEVHIYWTKKSRGSLFDFGIAFYQHIKRNLPIRLINRSDVEKIVEEAVSQRKQKSFEHVLLALDSRYQSNP
jgi:hypothetical protein